MKHQNERRKLQSEDQPMVETMFFLYIPVRTKETKRFSKLPHNSKLQYAGEFLRAKFHTNRIRECSGQLL